VYWRVRGHAAEGTGALRALLGAPAAQHATQLRARALTAAANLFGQTGGYAIAAEYCQEALAIARAVGDDYLVADLLQEQASVLVRQGQPGAALSLIESGLGLAGHLEEPHLAGRLLAVRSYIRDAQGSPAAGARDTAEAVRLFRQAGDRLQVGTMLGNLGYCELSAGDLDAARGHLAESLDIARALNARSNMVYGTFNLGLAEYLGGAPDMAGAMFAESLDLARRAGMRSSIAYALIGLAMAGRGGADPGWSARLHGAADQALADLGHALEPLEARLAGRDRERLRAAMGPGAFDAEYAAGRILDPAQVLDALGRKNAAPGQARAAAVSGDAVTVLTPRELDVLKLVAQGLSNPDIARRLVLSEHTVHRHLANILRKLSLSSRSAAAAWGVRTGLV
jgi:ATP/maltotriose-dependent transcriptional regulator MalT